MSRLISILAALCVLVGVNAAPPTPPGLYQRMPDHLVDYFMENSEQLSQQLAAYNSQAQAQQKQGEQESGRLENLEPDSEVELIPGAQQPQQPPQQSPVNPNVPGLVPGQRGVFIVHMPVPGLRPGTIGGYQPIYIVAAAPQGNTAYAANGVPVQGIQGVQGIPGYQNAILVNPAAPAGQAPYFPYPILQAQFQRGQYPGGQAQYVTGQAQIPVGQQGLLFGGTPLGFRGLEPVYQQQVHPGFAYQQAGQQRQLQQQQPQQVEGFRGGAVQLSQLIGLQQGQQVYPTSSQQRSAEAEQDANQKRVGEAGESVETKEALRDAQTQQRNARPTQTKQQNL